MNMAIAILGLALLVLVHELGHFSTARLVGMNPRRFYIGFPPAVFKVTRKGTEYGIGAIPLGGYVKIPGMHRPAASDLDLSFSRALAEDTGLLAPLERVKRELVVFDLEQARAALPELERATAEATPLAAGRQGRRARPLGPARRARRRRVLARVDLEADRRDPRRACREHRLRADRLLVPVHVRRRQGDDDRPRRAPGEARGHGRAQAGRPDRRDRRPARERVGDPEPDQQLERPPARADRAARRGHAPDRARAAPEDRGRLPARLRPERQGPVAAGVDLGFGDAHRERVEADRHLAHQPRAQAGPQGHLERGRESSRARLRRSARAR